MRKILTFSTLAIFFSAVLSSCGTTDSNNSKSGSKTEEKTVVFEGKYLLKSSKENYMIFRTDGTGEEKTSFGLEQFKWRKDKNQLCISKSIQLDETSEPIETPESCGKFTLTGSDLTWEMDGFTVYLIKAE